MNTVKQLIHKVGSALRNSGAKGIKILIAVLLTISVATAIPVYAWFSRQRKAAEMFKVANPNALYINAAQREDQVQFELGGININAYVTNERGEYVDAEGELIEEGQDPIKITKKQYVFSVSGSNVNSYILQMAHTTNNQFTYKLYEATRKSTEPEDNATEFVKYTPNSEARSENPLTVIGDDLVDSMSDNTARYYWKGDEVTGTYKNQKIAQNAGNTPTEVIAQSTEDTKYYTKNFKSNNALNNNVESHAVPLYWQTTIGNVNLQWDSNKRFCDYYILEVTWNHRANFTIEDKETDLIYLAVKGI